VDNLLAHYGIDWLAMTLSLYGAYLLGNKKEIGFIVFAVSNVIWIVLGLFFMSSFGMALGNLAFCLINLRGYIAWTKSNSDVKSNDITA